MVGGVGRDRCGRCAALCCYAALYCSTRLLLSHDLQKQHYTWNNVLGLLMIVKWEREELVKLKKAPALPTIPIQ